MNTIREYCVAYLKIERYGYDEDIRVLGVDDASIEREMAIRKNVVDALAEMTNRYNQDLRENVEYANSVGEGGVKTQHFGPILVAYVQKYNKNSAKAVYSIMALELPRLLRKLGASGRYVRGALVQGYGWEIEQDGCRTLYGPVMHKAWIYLTEYAYSPRIVIEEEIYQVVSRRNSYGPGKDGDWLPLYTCRDYDGQGILNYLVCDTTSPMVQHDTVRVVISEIQAMYNSVNIVIGAIAQHHDLHDGSRTIRMLLALREYVGTLLKDWQKMEARG